MRRLALVVTCLAATVALSGCLLKRSPVPRTYVLAAAEAQHTAQPSSQSVAVIGVTKVGVPSWLDTPTVMAHAAGGEIIADELSRWGEPLARGAQRVLTENLVALLPDRRVLADPFPPRQIVDFRVEVTIADATRQADGSVLVDARWEIVSGTREALVRRRSAHRAHPAAPGAPGDVAAVNEALAALCREIADAVRTLPPPAAKQVATPTREP
jgi:uncharacterized lipoprotein YmbA